MNENKFNNQAYPTQENLLCSEPQDFVFRGEMRQMVEKLTDTYGSAKGISLLHAIVDFGVTGQYFTDDAIIDAMMQSIIPSIKDTQGRYEKAIMDGKKGGRPKKVNFVDTYIAFHDHERPYNETDEEVIEEIARRYGVSASTIKRVLASPPENDEAMLQSLKNSLAVTDWIRWYIKKIVQHELGLVHIEHKNINIHFNWRLRLAERYWLQKYRPCDLPPTRSRADALYRASVMMEEARPKAPKINGDAGFMQRNIHHC